MIRSFLTLILLVAVRDRGTGSVAQSHPVAMVSAVKPDPAALIPWSATRPLAVADFLARPAYADQMASSTSTDIKANASCRDFVFTGTVQATFDPNTSWFREPKTASLALLRHEQLHFDITEVYARMMRQKLAVFQTQVNCNKLQPAFNNLTKAVYQNWDREQNRYDQETNHGLNAVRQAFWEKQTQAKLVQWQAFAQ